MINEQKYQNTNPGTAGPLPYEIFDISDEDVLNILHAIQEGEKRRLEEKIKKRNDNIDKIIE